MQDALLQAVTRVRAEAEARWPVVIDTTRWWWDDGPRCDGGVLIAAQAQAYAEAIEAATSSSLAPTVLSALDTPWTTQTWAQLTGERPVDLHRGPDEDDLQTQWTPPAVLRLFAARAERALVQLPDGTLGWIDSDRVDPATPDADPWAGIRRAGPEPITVEASVDEAAQVARRRLGRPYRWGGNTDAAADCSGFVQSVLFQTAGVLLPKNTRDQRRLGARVAAPAIAPGDLVFVQGRHSRLGHVGLALPREGATVVIHSCLSRERILEDPVADFLERYRFVGARRPVAWAAR